MRLLTTIINKQTQPWFAGGPAFKSVLHILNDNLVPSKTRHRAHAKDKRASAGARTEKQQKERLQKEVAKLERTLTREEHAEEHALHSLHSSILQSTASDLSERGVRPWPLRSFRFPP